MLVSNCAVCGKKTLRFIKDQEAFKLELHFRYKHVSSQQKFVSNFILFKLTISNIIKIKK